MHHIQFQAIFHWYLWVYNSHNYTFQNKAGHEIFITIFKKYQRKINNENVKNKTTISYKLYLTH